jgi:hypothetical protein
MSRLELSDPKYDVRLCLYIFFFLDVVSREGGTHSLFLNVGKELPLNVS